MAVLAETGVYCEGCATKRFGVETDTGLCLTNEAYYENQLRDLCADDAELTDGYCEDCEKEVKPRLVMNNDTDRGLARNYPKPRKARCGYYGKRCKSEALSRDRANLAFFKETPDRDYDDYYCGCYGWN
jgi:hypothetical protein